jgi:hypothetical protein
VPAGQNVEFRLDAHRRQRVHLISSRRARVLTAAFAVAVVGLSAPAAGISEASRSRLDIDHFMTGLACVESGGRYDALNPRSKALGKYQFMPRIWVAWAGRYLGNRWARPTPRNQEFVARQRIIDLYELHGDWRLVAHWWRTGNAPRDESRWTAGSKKYVGRIMTIAGRASSPSLRGDVHDRCFPRDLGQPRVRTEPWPRVVVTGGSVNLRRGPGAAHRVFEVAHRGDRLAVLGRARDGNGRRWLQVGLKDGRRGWLAAWYTAPLD